MVVNEAKNLFSGGNRAGTTPCALKGVQAFASTIRAAYMGLNNSRKILGRTRI